MTKPVALSDPKIFEAQATAQYASLAEQIDEIDLANAQMRNDIAMAEHEIKKRREAIAINEANRKKLMKRKRIIARAHFQLEQVDEE